MFFVLGLKLTLDIEVDDYVTDLADSAGVRLLIHNPYNMPFVEDGGLSLPPGRASLIGIKKVSKNELIRLIEVLLWQHEKIKFSDINSRGIIAVMLSC